MQVPLLLEMAGRPILCVGGGPVAAGKVGPLLLAGAQVTVIAPQVHDDLAGAHEVLPRRYHPGDVDRDPRPMLVVCGTGVADVDDAVAAEAAALGIWCLRIAGPSDVTVPAVVRRGDLLLAMTTGAPALTTRLRQLLSEVVDDRWQTASSDLAALRRDPAVRAALAAVEPGERRRRWARAVDVALAPTQPETIPDTAREVLHGRD